MRKNDSTKRDAIFSEVNATLNLMNNFRNIETNPYAYEKIQTGIRYRNENYNSKFSFATALPSFIIILVLLINLFSFYMIVNSATANGEDISIKDLKTEYQISFTDYLERMSDL